MKLPALYILIAIIICLCHGCGHDDSRLDYIYGLAEENPKRALQLLDSLVDCSAVDTLDAYYTLTRIRVNDRNYIRHTSNEKIMDVVKHYSDRPADPHYPDALYYAARVYSDIGDYPSSLIYFHKALVALPDQSESNLLRSAILSQTGRMLEKMRMYRDADISLVEAIKLDDLLKDSLNLMYNNQLLGIIRLNDKRLVEGRKCFSTARRYAQKVSPSDTLPNDIFIAKTYFLQGKNDTALKLIRNIPEHVSSDYLNNALSNAALIYLANDLQDSAQMYARRLIQSPSQINRKVGYRVLLSPQLNNRLPIDTLLQYVEDYVECVESGLNHHQSDLEVAEQAWFNYIVHKEIADKAVAHSDKMDKWLRILLYILGISVPCYAGYAIHGIRERNRLRKRLRNLERLQTYALPYYGRQENERKLIDTIQGTESSQDISVTQEPESSPAKEFQDISSKNNSKETPLDRMSRDELLTHIKEYLDNLQEAGKDYEIPEVIWKSKVLELVHEYIKANRCIPNGDSMWDEIEKLVFSVSPYFQYHLELLIGSTLKTHHYHLFLLIKCGVTPTGLTILMSRSKGTISNTRANLAKAILGDKQSAQTMDLIIRML